MDKISKVNWTNGKGKCFERNNLSFSSKYVHFLSDFEIPIYDSYIWIIINGYLGQKNNEKISFENPSNFKEFYATFEKFKIDLGLENIWTGESKVTDAVQNIDKRVTALLK